MKTKKPSTWQTLVPMASIGTGTHSHPVVLSGLRNDDDPYLSQIPNGRQDTSRKDDWQDTGRVGGSREEPNNLCTPIIED
jgi:hypothetical protein